MLLTAGASGVPDSEGNPVCALPDIEVVPRGALRVPDVAFLRRAYPRLEHVSIAGHGVLPAEADALRGLHVEWLKAAAGADSGPPRVVALSAPRSLAVGERMRVQGRVRGIAPGGVATLSLEGPDGLAQTVELRGGTDGEATFSIGSNPTKAPGALEWKLRTAGRAEPVVVGAEVRLTALPRVLLLQAAPSLDASRLQRWLAEKGGAVANRTRVSAAHVRVAAANGASGELTRVDDAVLKQFDVIVASEAALSELSADERSALETAVRERGLGVLVVDEQAKGNEADASTLVPWRLTKNPSAEEAEESRMARLRLSDDTELVEPVAVLAGELTGLPLARPVARDAQERLVAAAAPLGRGWIGRSLVVDTWRWLQNGHDGVFAAFWTEILSTIAARASAGSWQIEKAQAPMFVNEPMALVWVGNAEAGRPPAARVIHRGLSRDEVPLPLTPDATDAARFRGLFWPERPGWHEVRMEDGGAFAFHVQPREALPGVREESRHATTARLVSAGGNAARVDKAGGVPADVRQVRRHLLEYLAFALFVAGTGILFMDTQRARSGGAD